jgi:histidine phosphotransferase ChpT
MDTQIELRVLELLCSRLCHDLISPVMAVNNGIELLADDEGGMSADIQDLLTLSAGAAAARLQYYCVAYGLGGQSAAPIGLPEAGRLTRGLLEDEKIDLDWPDDAATAEELSREGMKILLNLVLVGIESLPRGGTLRLMLNGSDIILTAQGVGAALREESAAAMAANADIEALSARSVQGYFLNYLIGLIGGSTQVDSNEPDVLRLTVGLPG